MSSNLKFQYTVSENWKVVYATLSLLSLVSSLVIPVVYLVSKKSRHHPAIILVLICIFEMVSCYHLMIWAMDLNNFLRFFGIYELVNLWTYGTFSGTEQQQQIDDDRVFCEMNLSMYFISLFFVFSYYVVLCLDLIITLKRPFISGRQRLVWYHLGVFINSFIAFGFTWPNIEKQCNETVNNKPVLYIAYTPVIFVQMNFYFWGIISIIMASQAKLRNSTTNKELYKAKNQYLTNHILLISMLFMIWSVPSCSNMIQKLNKGSEQQYQLLNSISFCIIISQGIFLGIVRLGEKFFRNRLKLLIKSVLGQVSLQELELMQQSELQDNPDLDSWNFSLATLAGQAQNQEVVSYILQGVVQITNYRGSDASSGYNSKSFPSVDVLRKQCQEDKTQIFKAKDGSQWTESFRSSLVDTIENPKDGKQQQVFLPGIPLLQTLFHKNDFGAIKVTEYAHKVFRVIRNKDNISHEEFQRSLSLQANIVQIKKAQQSLGKSGSFFFFSHDNRLILKTMSNTELVVLKKTFLKTYILHLISNPKSLLAKVYGAYTISISNVAPINLIMMENTLGSLSQHGGATQLYDLKGSTTNRFVKTQSLSPVVLKDQNYLESQDLFLELLSDDRQKLLEQLQNDTEFLKSIKIMDYSLLMGIAKNNQTGQIQDVDPNNWSSRSLRDANGNVISLALIDYLQQFDFLKQLEFRYKTIIKQDSKDLISCVLPNQYQARFMNFMKQILCSVTKDEE